MTGHYSRLHWRNQKTCVSSAPENNVKSWLFDESSLTERLIGHCNGKFSIKVLSITRATPTVDEIKALNLRARSHAIIRQVLLLCDGEPLVFARTIIPLSSLRGSLRGIVLLGNKSLGAILFADKSMRRQPVEVVLINARKNCQIWPPLSGIGPVWGRRSVFLIKQQKLLVSEFFLPDLY